MPGAIQDFPAKPSFATVLNRIDWTSFGDLDKRPYRPEVFEEGRMRRLQERALEDQMIAEGERQIPHIEDDETRETIDYLFNREMDIRNEVARQDNYEAALTGF